MVIWQFRSRIPEARERLALRLIAVSFFTLAAWVTVDAARLLLGAEQADTSVVGIAIAATSVVVMPLLVWAKRRTGRELGSATVVADSMQTMLCTYRSVIVLAGLLLNATLGWWWTDPVAPLVIAAVAVREGVEAWRGEQCDDCALPTAAGSGGDADGCECGPAAPTPAAPATSKQTDDHPGGPVAFGPVHARLRPRKSRPRL
ncbi:hypothetical protein Vau01_123690 [Virgisporangium aurantiacum]|uniref:Cation efflux protein transmembrane domain-containing protein n=1 Tax=Virgisporangium aurantiacum TaxID=175570 RepID=A0A8J3ZNE8_9ACTN|nr:hypothetical protein Vau01_123690 [Virgisporangium aurantiacum]